MHFFHPFFFFKKKIERTALRIAFFSTHLRAERIQRKKEADGCALLRKKNARKKRRKKKHECASFFSTSRKAVIFFHFFSKKKKSA